MGLPLLFAGVANAGPSSIPGLMSWYKADVGTYQDSGFASPAAADGDVVGGWRDQSGNGRDLTQPTTANKAVLKLNIQNGRPVVWFDGTDDVLLFTTTALAAWTVFVAYKVTATAGFAGPLAWRDTGVAGLQLVSDQGTVWQPHVVVWSGAAETSNSKLASGARAVPTAFLLDEWVSTPALYTNTASLALAAGVTAFASAGGSVGRGLNSGLAFLTMDLGELIIYNSVLADAQRQTVERYLNQRWGMY